MRSHLAFRVLALASLAAAALISAAEAAVPSGAAPLYVALVKVADLAPYSPSTSVPVSAAAAWRAAAYPPAPRMSRTPLPRATDELQDPPGPVTELAVAQPVGPGGPTLEPLPSSSSSSSTRRLKQQQVDKHGYLGGFQGITAAAPAGTSVLAVGPTHVLQAAGPVITITNVTSAGERIPDSSRSVALSAVMAGAAADCEDVFDPSSVFDQAAGRYLVTATCGAQGRVLLAASATSDPSANWFVFGLVADGVNSSAACLAPVRESAVVDYTQVTYDSDGIYVTYKSICPSNTTNSGVGILALPKYAIYKGMPNFLYPIYTSGNLHQALGAADSSTSPSSKVPCNQLAPAVAQVAADIPDGAAYFVCKDAASRPGSVGQAVIIVALLDTSTLWQYGGPNSDSSSPLLTAQRVQWGDWRSVVSGVALQQPPGGPSLQLGTNFRDFWNGAAVLSGGRLFLACSTAVQDPSTPVYSRRPSIAWAELSVGGAVGGADTCPQSKAGHTARQAFDWSKDYSWKWGAEFDLNYTQHGNVTFAPRMKSVASTSPSISHSVLHAGVGIPGRRLLATATLGAFGLGALTLYGGDPCTCYRCYWGGSYYRYGGYNGGALAGNGYGYSGTGYYFAQGMMSRCQSTCTRCWYYGYPGYGFGNVGADLNDPITRPFLQVQSVQGELSPQNNTEASLDHPALAEPSLNQQKLAPPTGSQASADSPTPAQPSMDQQPEGMVPVAARDIAALRPPCNRSVSLEVKVVRGGILTQGGQQAVGMVYPAVAVGQHGDLLVMYTYAGPGTEPGGGQAYPGAGAALIGTGSTSGFQTIRIGQGSILPAVAPGASAFGSSSAKLAAGWAELSASAVHAASGTIFTAVHYAVADDNQPTSVATWLSSWLL